MNAILGTQEKLAALELNHLKSTWGEVLKNAKAKQPSYQRLLEEIIDAEYDSKKERMRLARLRRAQIPEIMVLETFPFERQPQLKKRLVTQIYDSMEFITQHEDLVFIGPTGCGKTGLGTSFLVHAINKGYRGCFIDFGRLIHKLQQSKGDMSEEKILRLFESYDVLLIDELGYTSLEKDQAGLFFELMKRRHKKHCTILTTQLGFEEWANFLQSPHLTAALLDRITVNCAVFNMKTCISIRPKRIVYGSDSQEPGKKK
ncbi:MAG: ATP-binding protein [Bacteroidota bacterium]